MRNRIPCQRDAGTRLATALRRRPFSACNKGNRRRLHAGNHFANRAIFVWPWNENARTKQKQQTNGNRAIWLVYRMDTNACGFWLVKRTLGWNKPILRFDVILRHNWPIEQCLLHITVFFGGKTRSPCFDLFIHWLIKQITNTYRNHFQGHTKIALSVLRYLSPFFFINNDKNRKGGRW